MQQFLDVALTSAAQARTIIMDAYTSNHFGITIKADQTPVTEVDIAVEKAIKSFIHQHFPTHGFFGEEEGAHQLDAEYVWLLDPIDGTKAFIRGRPFFSCQIALMHQGEFILGVSCAPAFNGGELAYAVKGKGAFLNDQPLKISTIDTLNQAIFSSGNIKSLANNPSLWSRYAQLLTQVNATRGFGDFLHYHLLSAGKIDLVIESDVNILDVAALSVIVQEAGGLITQLDGQPLTLDSSTILAANPTLHAAAKHIMNPI